MAEDTQVVETSDELKFTEEELQNLQNLQIWMFMVTYGFLIKWSLKIR